MYLRKAEIRDIASDLFSFYQANLQFHAQARPDYFYLWDDKSVKQNLKIAIETGNFLVLEDWQKKLVWFVYYTFKDEGKKIIWIKELFITEKERKKGYWKFLINEIKKIGLENHCLWLEFCCWWFNENALAMYQHLGMKMQRVILETDFSPFL